MARVFPAEEIVPLPERVPMVVPEALTFVTSNVVPPARLTGTTPIVPLPERSNIPSLTVALPRVFELLNVRVPVPCFTRRRLPLIDPEKT